MAKPKITLLRWLVVGDASVLSSLGPLFACWTYFVWLGVNAVWKLQHTHTHTHTHTHIHTHMHDLQIVWVLQERRLSPPHPLDTFKMIIRKGDSDENQWDNEEHPHK